MRLSILVVGLLAAVTANGCMQYRQNVKNVSPAPQSDECPDMAHGCGKTVWALAWGVVNVGLPKAAECGSVGMQEVTVRATPVTFLIGAVTVGLVTPRRIDWKCAAPTPLEGDLNGVNVALKRQ